MDEEREILGVLGEIASQGVIALEKKDIDMLTSLASRYVIIVAAQLIQKFCNLRYGDLSACLEAVSSKVSEEDSTSLVDIISLGRDLILLRGNVGDEQIFSSVKRLPKIYVLLERLLMEKH